MIRQLVFLQNTDFNCDFVVVRGQNFKRSYLICIFSWLVSYYKHASCVMEREGHERIRNHHTHDVN